MQKFKFFALVMMLVLGSAWAQDWEPPGAPSARQGHSMVTLPDGRILLFGGEDAQGSLFNDIYAFNTDSWEEITPNNSPPPARRDHQAWARGDAMYVYGGYGENGVLDDMWRYDSAANTWQPVQISGPRPVARHGHTTTTMSDGSVLIFGGTDANGNALKDFWKLNADNTFTQLADASDAYTEHCSELVGNDDLLLVFGIPGIVSLYQFSAGMWGTTSGGPPISGFAVSHQGVNAAGDPVIFFFGGKDANGNESADIYEYNLTNGETTLRGAMKKPVVNGAGAPMGSQQSSMLPGGIVNCVPVADEETSDLQMVFFGGLTNGVPTNTSQWFSSGGTPPPPPPPPPPTTGKITCDTDTLGQGRFTMYVVKFPQGQEKVDVKLTWEESKAKLYLLTLALPAAGREFTSSNAALRYLLRRLWYFHVTCPKLKNKHYKKWRRKYRRYRRRKNVEYETTIEKSFENVQFLLLLVKHCRFSKTAKNVRLEIDKMTDNPGSVSYIFPIGGFKRKHSPRIHSVKLPVEPVRWFSKYPRKAKVEEKTESGENFWKWICIDSSRRRCFCFYRLAFVKFILP